MVRAGLLIATGISDVLATSAAISLEVLTLLDASDSPPLLAACGVAAAMQAMVLLTLIILGLAHLYCPSILSSGTRSTVALFCQLSTCVAAVVPSGVSIAYMYLSDWIDQEGSSAHPKHSLLIGLTVSLATSTTLQFAFILLYFAWSRAKSRTPSTESPRDAEEGRKLRIKGFRYSQTMSAAQKRSVQSSESPSVVPEMLDSGPLGHIRASVSQVIRPATSKTKLLTSASVRRPVSMDSVAPAESIAATFDSWDTSSVDAHNRQVVVNVSTSPTIRKALETVPGHSSSPPSLCRRSTLESSSAEKTPSSPITGGQLDTVVDESVPPTPAFKRVTTLETIPASPSGSRTPSRPNTPFDLEDLVPPRRIRTINSYASSLHSQFEGSGPTSTGSLSELDIHPLFRSTSATPPPAASARTSVVAAPNAGQVISRSSSAQSLRRLRSGSLPAAPSPLTRQINSDGIERSKTKDESDDAWRRNSDGVREDEVMTPPVPEWLFSPRMKASLESFKEMTGDDEASEARAT